MVPGCLSCSSISSSELMLSSFSGNWGGSKLEGVGTESTSKPSPDAKEARHLSNPRRCHGPHTGPLSIEIQCTFSPGSPSLLAPTSSDFHSVPPSFRHGLRHLAGLTPPAPGSLGSSAPGLLAALSTQRGGGRRVPGACGHHACDLSRGRRAYFHQWDLAEFCEEFRILWMQTWRKF